MDAPIDNPSEEMGETDNEFPVKLDSLDVGGVRPAVGDSVEVTVKGSISRIVDDCAYVTAESVNDTPIEELHQKDAESKSKMSEGDMMDMAQSADMAGGSPYG